VSSPGDTRAASRWHPLANLAAYLRTRAARWMRSRQGQDLLPVVLERRRLYILPSAAGSAFAALLFLMLLAGLNYANSLALFVTFVLGGFALVVMQQCHRNLLGVEVARALAPPVFAGTTAAVQLTFVNRGPAPRLRLAAALPGTPAIVVDVAAGGECRVDLPLAAQRRGRVLIERFKVSTAHPFGLFRAWTWVHTPIELLVYPRAHGSLPAPGSAGPRAGTRAQVVPGADEWLGLRPFRDGDSPRQVDWKAYAREAPLLVKEYSAGESQLRMFDFATLLHLELEARLAQLARWVVDAETHGERYGLSLPGEVIAPERGPEHRHRCLAALALYGRD
jgi:uncharacterized protein (DUF58 family)